MTERAATEVHIPDQGSLADDLQAFLTATIRSARDAAPALRAVLVEAQRDPHAAELLTGFTERRRAALREVFERGSTGIGIELLIDQAFGVLW